MSVRNRGVPPQVIITDNSSAFANLRGNLGFGGKRKDVKLLEEITRSERDLATLQQRGSERSEKALTPLNIDRVRKFLWRL